MLDTVTKKRIDDCRDILVGKLPDPKAQIEQITIGLIYKFMDDMDKEAIELGGTAKFFSGDYEKYSWSSLFDTKVTAAEMLRLYSEAIESMEKNPNIPTLFRNIFNNAYLPYRDPETLKLFLKTIGEFEYTHSEMLGDAFEYLLSVMGSQGDAGQFRTPRHIIDFLVAVVNPGKNDTVLDPACGTAGFLISAFKHIKEKNNNELTPDERKKLIQNFVGYDISPDMVRLSLVNLYLHGFSDPDIQEYDTLSSEERWNDSFDVILANPPFMSPKGGIRPHKKFSISSNRSEVLFVDYIAEHLNPKGRAGIIVPEGVIFQSGTAYKELRKMLVDNYLYAVVSLPAGIFNPYSGVKTSILLMDKELAKKTNEILFVKIDNDGFNLGAQRNAVKGGQLEEAIKIIHDFAGDGKSQSILPSIAHIVPKTEISKNGDYNLSGERYKTVFINLSSFPYVNLGEIAEVTSSKRIFKEEYVDEGIPFYRTKEIVELNKKSTLSIELFISEKKYKDIKDKFGVPKKGDILISAVGTLGIPWLIDDDRQFYFKDGNLIWIKNIKNANSNYIKHILEVGLKNQLVSISIGAAYKALTIDGLKKLKIPLPPLFIQQEIVAEIEVYQKIIDGAKMVVENYKPKIDIDPEWEMVELGEVCGFMTGGTPTSTVNEYYEKGTIKWLVSGDIHQGEIWECPNRITEKGMKSANTKFLPINSVLIALNGQGKTRATVAILRIEATCNQSLVSINPLDKNQLIPEFLYFKLKEQYKEIRNITGDNQRSGLSISIIKTIEIPLPPLNIQQEIVARINQELRLVNSNKQLIKIFEQTIKDRIAKVWGTEKEQEENLSMAAEQEAEYQSSVK